MSFLTVNKPLIYQRMREALDSHVGSHDSWIKGILSSYSKVKVKVFGIKYNNKLD